MAKKWRSEEPSKPTEQLPCLVVKSTPDGYAVGRGLASADSIEWLSPTHTREWLETRPKDITVTAEKWANEDGTVTLKPTRVNKGAPVPTRVGYHIVFGELYDSAAHRAKGELAKMLNATLKGRRTYWRHRCPVQSFNELPLWSATPNGEVCSHCGATEGGKAKVA